MAKINFVGLDGAEKVYRLQTHRPFTVGRDPGNDIILRDPKVSRHHAEIVFERGFFVLHDLASANGSFVNGKRIRVAPLTHGSRLRLGNTMGRFSEEIPTESEALPLEAVPDASGAHRPTEAMPPVGALADADARPSMQTVPHELIGTGSKKKTI
jgi:predicted component of type VI protein secretion system